MEVAQEELATKLECTTLAMEKNNIGESLNDEEQTLIGSGAKTKLLLREYEEIIEVLNDNVRNNHEPGMSASSPDELHALIALLYCCSKYRTRKTWWNLINLLPREV